MMRYILLLIIVLSFTTCKDFTKGKFQNEKLCFSEQEFQLHSNDDLSLGTPPSIGIDTEQNILVFQRALPNAVLSEDGLIQENSVLIFENETGVLLTSWGANQFKNPHGLTVDRNNNIWLTDIGLQQVFKFTHDGQLLMTFGEKEVAGCDRNHFDRPTDVAVAADGTFYVTDGYGNNRVVKFSSDGQYLTEWGVGGTKEGEFNLPHAIDIDKMGNLYVADRENKRIQMFDSSGKFLKTWTDNSFGSIQSVIIDDDGSTIYAVDYKLKEDKTPLGSDIIILNAKSGEFAKIKHSEDTTTPPSRFHDLAVDKNGNLFTVDILQNKIHKFKLK